MQIRILVSCSSVALDSRCKIAPFSEVTSHSTINRALLRASQRMKTNEEYSHAHSATALCLRHYSNGSGLNFNLNKVHDEARRQTRPGFPCDQGSDQPGAGHSQTAWFLRR